MRPRAAAERPCLASSPSTVVVYCLPDGTRRPRKPGRSEIILGGPPGPSSAFPNYTRCSLDYGEKERTDSETTSMVRSMGELVEAAAMSDVPQDLGALYIRHRDAMHRVAASVLREAGRASEAGDVVHDAIVSIMASPPRAVRSWEAFLVTAAKRKALDRIRSAEVRHAGPELAEVVHDRATDSDLADDVADAIDQLRRAGEAWDCLSILDERHRKVVWETVALARPRSEVATELNVTPARVSQITTRSLALLREEMCRREEGNDE